MQSLNQSYDIINPYKFNNIINIKTLDMSLFNIEKNKLTIIIQEIIKQKHVLKRSIKKSYDVIFIQRIIKRDHQYIRFEKTNDQR